VVEDTGRWQHTDLWRETVQIPECLALTSDRAEGFEEVAALLQRDEVERVVVSGSGASYYAALALWLAALGSESAPAELVAVPAGFLAAGAFRWRSGDALVAVSTSGESRDLLAVAESEGAPRPFAVITADPNASLPLLAGAVARTVVLQSNAVTHSQAFCALVGALCSIWALVSGDQSLGRAVGEAPPACDTVIEATPMWVEEYVGSVNPPPAAIAFGSGPAWAAALEGALLLKEVARVPCEGSETREGATTTMTELLPDYLVVSIPRRDDSLAHEAEALSRSLGCRVLSIPGGAEGVERLVAVTTFAPLAALSIDLGLKGGWDVDHPSWYADYESTARRTKGPVPKAPSPLRLPLR
jgi:fructoselysine-6-P-deglycase FrlB-like protein